MNKITLQSVASSVLPRSNSEGVLAAGVPRLGAQLLPSETASHNDVPGPTIVTLFLFIRIVGIVCILHCCTMTALLTRYIAEEIRHPHTIHVQSTE